MMIMMMMMMMMMVGGVLVWYFMFGPGKKPEDDDPPDDEGDDPSSNVTVTRTYTKLTNADVPGNDITCYRDGSNASFCKAKCDADTTCKAYNYVPRGGVWGPDTSGCCIKTANGPVGYYEGTEFYRLDGKTSDSSSKFNGEVYTIKSMLKSTYLSAKGGAEDGGVNISSSSIGSLQKWVFYPVPGQANNIYMIRNESQGANKATYSWLSGNGDPWDADHLGVWKDAGGPAAWWEVSKASGQADGVYTIRNVMRSRPSPTPATLVYTFSWLGALAATDAQKRDVHLLTTGNTSASYWKIEKAT